MTRNLTGFAPDFTRIDQRPLTCHPNPVDDTCTSARVCVSPGPAMFNRSTQPTPNSGSVPKRCAGPVSRREFLRLGAMGVSALGLGSFGISDLMRMRAAQAAVTGTPEPETAVIFVWLPGGPPHLDMYDMKPGAPAEYRGLYRPISTTVPGFDVCELMPLHAKLADKFNVVRSISHEFADHGGGHKRLMTGRVPKSPVETVNDAPAVGSIVARCREDHATRVPGYVCVVEPGRDQVDTFAQGAAYLGPSYVPFMVPGDPSRADFSVPNIAPIAQLSERLDDRSALLSRFDQFRRDADQSGLMQSMDQFHRRALTLITSQETRQAFDLQREPEAVRTRYGAHAWGQRLLMARRLVEAGTHFCSVVLENPYQSGVDWLKQGAYNWDSHAVNCHIYDDLNVRLPIYDKAVSALIEDLYARGLDKRVLVVVTGEFGRTPRIEHSIGTQTGVMQPGRDHWPQSMSLITFGGGMRTGQIIGSTNSRGEHPKDRPLTPNDLWATVYRHLGIDPEMAFPDHHGRPMPILPFGSPINELLPVA